jgi:hypothetical protein
VFQRVYFRIASRSVRSDTQPGRGVFVPSHAAEGRRHVGRLRRHSWTTRSSDEPLGLAGIGAGQTGMSPVYPLVQRTSVAALSVEPRGDPVRLQVKRVGVVADNTADRLACRAALENAVRARRPPDTVAYSDRASQFRSRRFVESLRHYGLPGPMGRVGPYADNTTLESNFFADAEERPELSAVAQQAGPPIQRIYHRRRWPRRLANSHQSNMEHWITSYEAKRCGFLVARGLPFGMDQSES